jgi:hypothetical protein
MKTYLHTQIEQLQELAKVYTAFMLKHEENILIPCSFSAGDTPALNFICHSNDRNQILYEVGRVFGKECWKRSISAKPRHVDWTKVVDDVLITVFEAEVMTSMKLPDAVFPSA